MIKNRRREPGKDKQTQETTGGMSSVLVAVGGIDDLQSTVSYGGLNK